MNAAFETRPVAMRSGAARNRIERLLASAGLRAEEMPPYMLAVYDADDRPVACGGLDGNVIKCVAVDSACRSENLTTPLIGALTERTRAEGHDNVFVYTKPENEKIFTSLAFSVVGRAEKAILLESDRHGIDTYCRRIARQAGVVAGEKVGVIVINANPLTIGHRYLIERAAASVNRLIVIPVASDRSHFPACERRAMLETVCDSIHDTAVVVDGSDYLISGATFPTYFLKDLNDAAETQMALDCDIFNRHIAPALGATLRFVGTEPTDALTAGYNAAMRSRLDIELVEMARFEIDGVAVSASRLRRAIAALDGRTALRLAAEEARPYVLADLAAEALRAELDLTPKPGLVDRKDNGAHTDMDHALMARSIATLRRHLPAMARRDAKVTELQQAGIKAEQAMLEATGGVNTHRGAIFCMSLMIAAAARVDNPDSESLSREIALLASGINAATDTHGAHARRDGRLAGGALDNARQGYSRLFAEWLPYYRSLPADDPTRRHKLLLAIMAGLDDSNIAWRGGAEALAYVKERAATLLDDFSLERLAEFNADLTARNISPGGAADMLALTLLADAIIPNYDSKQHPITP